MMSTSHRVASECSLMCRTLSQLVLHHLLEEFPEALQSGAAAESAGHAGADATPWRACLQFFRTNPDMQRLERSMGQGLSQYSPAQAITPTAVFCTVQYSAQGCSLRTQSQYSHDNPQVVLSDTLIESRGHDCTGQSNLLRPENSRQAAACTSHGCSKLLPLAHCCCQDIQAQWLPIYAV